MFSATPTQTKSEKRKNDLIAYGQKKGYGTPVVRDKTKNAANQSVNGTPALTEEQKIKQTAENSKTQRHQAREEGVKWGEEFFNRPVSGLAPEKKKAMQYEAQRQAQRQLQSANRHLLGEQGRRGITGNSGIAYAQQRDLRRVGDEVTNQALRDVEKLDADMQMKKIAALFNVGQGEATQAQLDQQRAEDELRLAEDRKRQKRLEDFAYQQYSRI